jgi:hypothetical protein
MTEPRDEFLSEEDLDLRSLSDEELDAVWTAWLRQAQSTNDEDRFTYSHGVFTHDPSGDTAAARDTGQGARGSDS